MKNNQTLEIGQYTIHEGCKATVSGGVIEISIKKDNRIKEGDWRCKDCKHRIDGKTLAHNDGLSEVDWRNWFERYDLTEPLAVIHFTKFRYRYEQSNK